MRSVKKWRHYCDFCSMAKMIKPAMVKHETGCTLNPARVCGLCNLIGNVQEPIQKLKDAFWADTEKMTVLRKLCENCPACILAAIRQINQGTHPKEQIWPEFEFKKELDSFWNEYNAMHNQY